MSGRPATTTAYRQGDRIIEVMAVVLLGVATLGTVWCGYQATRWNGREAELTRDAAKAQSEGARLFGLATQTASYDSNVIAQYAQAFSSGNTGLMAFYRQTLIRPELLPLLDRWEQQIHAGQAPTNLLEDKDYVDSQLKAYQDAVAQGDALTAASNVAGDHADAYVLTTLLLAAALFFAGITTSFRIRIPRLMLLAVSSVTIAYAAARLIDLPVV
jgi:hypothetical protein